MATSRGIGWIMSPRLRPLQYELRALDDHRVVAFEFALDVMVALCMSGCMSSRNVSLPCLCDLPQRQFVSSGTDDAPNRQAILRNSNDGCW